MKKILIVDDEPHICTILKQFLERSDYKVDSAMNGQQALDKIAQENEIEPIELDKMFWIIGSGKWSVDGYKKHASLKKEYLKSV